MSFALNPYPHGCPIALAADPQAFRELVPELVMRLMDVYSFSVHVVEPSRGEPYPLLNVLPEPGRSPSVVLFPGWEDARRKRRVDFKRQATLLDRIRKNGVAPERVEDVVALNATVLDDPLIVNFAVTAAQMSILIGELEQFLGDRMRVTVQTVDPKRPIPLRIVRLYAPTSESAPRIIGFPGWRAAVENPEDELGEDACMEILERAEVEAVAEVPIEVFTAPAPPRPRSGAQKR